MMKQTLTVLFGVSVAVANITAAKLAWFELPGIGGVSVPAGFLAFGVAYLCSDLLVEHYGREYAENVINSTVVALVAAYVLVYASIVMPAAPFYESHAAYVSTLGSSAAVVAASVVTMLVSQHIDVRIFAALKRLTDARHKWLRNLGSTTISQAVDTVIFITLAFALFPALQGDSVMWGSALTLTIVGQYTVKLIVAALDTPVFYLLTSVRAREVVA